MDPLKRLLDQARQTATSVAQNASNYAPQAFKAVTNPVGYAAQQLYKAPSNPLVSKMSLQAMNKVSQAYSKIQQNKMVQDQFNKPIALWAPSLNQTFDLQDQNAPILGGIRKLFNPENKSFEQGDFAQGLIRLGKPGELTAQEIDSGLAFSPAGMTKIVDPKKLMSLKANANIKKLAESVHLNTENMKSLLEPSSSIGDKYTKLKNLLTYDDQLRRVGVPASERASMDVKKGMDYLSNANPNSGKESMRFLQDVADEARKIKDPFQSSKTIDQAIMTSDVKKKVNIIDYLRTPENVLKKIGMGQQAQELRGAYDKYLDELPKEIDKITAWSKRVRPESNQRIFQWLDGKQIELDSNEMQVATEVRDYFKHWANRLGLPKESRVTNYITHLFERELVTKEFDPEIAKLIRDKVPGSVYDPFTQQRLGAKGYLEDTWQALDAYVKRATRKANLDPTLRKISDMSDGLEDSQFRYIKSYIDRVNMRPTDIDNLIDNFIKTSPFGYKLGQRPLTAVTRNARQLVYRGLLGLNPGSALKNLSQGANTYAKLGEKYTFIGYSKVVQNMPMFLAGRDTELNRVGVLQNGFIEDRTLNATRKFWENADKGLFYMFNLAEKINRGAAYYGAKAKGLNKGMNEDEAIEFAKKIVRETQFTFGSVDTPLALSSDLAKTLGQFQSYTLKQGEFLSGMVKNKDFLGLTRWLGASMAFVFTVGKAIGMEPTDLIPSVRIGTPPTLQAPVGAYEVMSGQPDKFGNDPEPNILKRAWENKNLTKGLLNYVPAGGQINKSIKGYGDVSKGYNETDNGSVRYPIERNDMNLIRGTLFGSNNLNEAQEYWDSGDKPLSQTQNDIFKSLPYDQKEEYYKSIQQQRDLKGQDFPAESLVDSNSIISEANADAGILSMFFGNSDDVKRQETKTTSISGNKLIYTKDGVVKTMDLPPYSNNLTGIDKYSQEAENKKIARNIYGIESIDENSKQGLYERLGVNKKDVEYDYLAASDNSVKLKFIADQMEDMSPDARANFLVQNRNESISGNRLISDEVVNRLQDYGYITEENAKELKKYRPDQKGIIQDGIRAELAAEEVKEREKEAKKNRPKKGRTIKPPTLKLPAGQKISLKKVQLSSFKPKSKKLKVKKSPSSSQPKAFKIDLSDNYIPTI